MKIQKNDLPGFEAVGRVTRAVTYAALANDVDLTLRELYAFTTLTQALETLNGGVDGDLIDGYMSTPGLGQAFFQFDQYRETFDSLEAKGLVKLLKSPHENKIASSIEKNVHREAFVAELTEAGVELLHAMGGNLAKSLRTLDREDVRQSLNDYA
ncbi:hypothetical protein [Aquabacterium sp.]|uniref:hypothetical protein n=1 Tax=Aquabacterium sp. TaxID=1872578 RepID=UPI003BB01EE4